MEQIEILFGFNVTSAYMFAISLTQDRFDFWWSLSSQAMLLVGA